MNREVKGEAQQVDRRVDGQADGHAAGRADRDWLDERYRQIIDQVEDFAILTLDPEGRVTSWNGGAERVLGYPEEEALEQPGAFIFTPEDREAGVPEQELEAALREGRGVDERWHVRRDGERIWGSGIVTPLYDDADRLTGYSKILRDLTRQREAERERERLLAEVRSLNETLEQRVAERTRELEKSERRFYQAFNAGPVAACLSTLGEERFIEVNDAFVKLTGYSREEAIGRSHKALGQWSTPHDLAKLDRLGEADFRNQELTLRTKGGTMRDLLLSREVIDLDGERVNLKQFYDITERKQNEKQLVDALRRVMSDTSWFAQKVVEELAQVKIGSDTPGPSVDLSKREREVLEHLARGMSNDAIGQELGIATQTVRNYISTVYDKLGVHSRGEAIVWARERGIV